MKEFYVGDRVTVSSSDKYFLRGGDNVYKITYIAGPFAALLNVYDETDHAGGVELADCTRVKPEVPKAKKVKKVSYSFSAPSYTLIDDKKIHNDLSYQNPMAIVEFGGHKYVVIHDSVLDKANRAIGGGEQLGALDKLIGRQHSGELFEIREENIKSVARVIRKIKTLPYQECFRLKGKVEVTYISI